VKEKLSANPVSICRPGEVDGIAAVILDVDGTLYDQAVIRRKMASELISAYILKPAAGFKLCRFLRRYRQAQERLRGLDLDGKRNCFGHVNVPIPTWRWHAPILSDGFSRPR
jgi:hypothetical protein